MKYRKLGNTGISVSEVGFGSEVFIRMPEEDALKLIDKAVELGVNYFDLYNSEPHVRSVLGKGMKGRREKFIIQGHFGSTWQENQYKRSRQMDEVKAAADDLFTRLDTDYIDVGFIHYVDEQKDFDVIFGGEFIEFIKTLKAEGKIHHIGLSTHNPLIAMEAAKTGLVEVIMLSINPAYDMLPPSENMEQIFEKETYNNDILSNIDPVRDELYRYCETNGIALTVMKPFAGGALLKAEESPFGIAMTVPQCLSYCLTRPAVATVLSGFRSMEQLIESAGYSELPEADKDYATVLSSAPAHSFSDKCMYCGHCAPCSVGIDIAMVNKLKDLCISQGEVPETVREHYAVLEAKASDCIACGICEGNCPFGVKIIEHMEKAVGIFGA